MWYCYIMFQFISMPFHAVSFISTISWILCIGLISTQIYFVGNDVLFWDSSFNSYWSLNEVSKKKIQLLNHSFHLVIFHFTILWILFTLNFLIGMLFDVFARAIFGSTEYLSQAWRKILHIVWNFFTTIFSWVMKLWINCMLETCLT